MQTYIIGGHVLAFSSALEPRFNEDIVCSTLTAQLQADAQFSNDTQHGEWEQQYQQKLGKMGWRRLERGEQTLVIKTPTFTFMDLLTDSLEARWPGMPHREALALIAAEQTLGSEAALRLEQHARGPVQDLIPGPLSAHVQPFGMQFAMVDDHGMMHTLCLACATSEMLEPVWLEQSLRTDRLQGSPQVRYHRAELLAARYQPLREGISQWLGKRRAALVQRLVTEAAS
nr:hypothetical protein [uncultured Pseudomonas sp.]